MDRKTRERSEPKKAPTVRRGRKSHRAIGRDDRREHIGRQQQFDFGGFDNDQED